MYGECISDNTIDEATKDELSFLLMSIKSILEQNSMSEEDIHTVVNYCGNIADALNIKLD